MKILITGHQGFIGKNMVNHLSNKHELSFYEWNDDKLQIENQDLVIHLGAITSTVEKNIEKVLSQNLDFSIYLLNKCIENQVDLQWASSASVYGLNTEFKETSTVDPKTPYAWSKYLFERHIEKNPTDKIKIQGFRYFNVYGKHEDHKKDQASPYHKFTQQAINNKKIKLFKNSENYFRDFVPVETVIKVHEKFFDIPKSGIWNIGTGKPKSFQNVADEIAEKYNAEIEYIDMPENLKNSYQKYTCADLEKLSKDISSLI